MKKLEKAAKNEKNAQKDHEKSLHHYQTETVPKYSAKNMPFFIVGSPRSGTTLLRDLLREHPRLECPEETHFFRWADPFGSPKFISHYNTKIFKDHRLLDQIDEIGFAMMMKFAHSREHLAWAYGHFYLKNKGKEDARLYDKSPQNVYGMFLINAVYPEAKFIHIYRNPLNVVASLMEGKVMPEHSLRGAINSWVESMMLLNQFKKFKTELLLEICYEKLVESPDTYLKVILEFLNEDPALLPSQKGKTHPEKNKYQDKLTGQEIQIVLDKCEPYLSEYGYNKGGKNEAKKSPLGFLKRLLS